ncbi:MAG: transporter of the drug/metabolite transporter superfamily, partial [Acidimicrobiales bacterium]|nr:transporter of the drug/metabolite transporter superfamily [Acidimicrobiales bacterium]
VTRVRRVQAAAERQPAALIGLGAVLFAIGPVLIAGADASGPVIAFWRLWIGCGFLGAVLLAYGRVTGRWPSRSGWSWAVRCGLMFALHQLLNTTALRRTSVVDVTLMQVLAPVIVAVLAVRLFDERPGVRFRLWSAVALGGAVVVALGGSSGPQGDPLGMLMAAGNVVFYAVYFVWSKQARDEIDVVPFLWGAVTTAAVVVSAFVLVSGEVPLDVSRTDILAAGAVALGPGAVGHFVSTWPLRWVPANVPPLLQLAIPFVAGFLAWLILGEAITVVHLLGGAITVAGVAGAIRSPAGRRMVVREEAVLVVGEA